MPAPQRRGATTGQLPRLANDLKAIQQELQSFLQRMCFPSVGRFGLAPAYPSVTRWDSRKMQRHDRAAYVLPDLLSNVAQV
jgi:hypothetical protein